MIELMGGLPSVVVLVGGMPLALIVAFLFRPKGKAIASYGVGLVIVIVLTLLLIWNIFSTDMAVASLGFMFLWWSWGIVALILSVIYTGGFLLPVIVSRLLAWLPQKWAVRTVVSRGVQVVAGIGAIILCGLLTPPAFIVVFSTVFSSPPGWIMGY